VISGRLSRLTASGNVSVGEQPLINDWCQQYPSHSIGSLNFGPDGYLYVSGGDGASFNFADWGQHVGNLSPTATGQANVCGDPLNEGGALRSQDLRSPSDPTTLDGAILRLDSDTGLGAPGNPNAGGDTINSIKQAAEFGIVKGGQSLAGLLVFATDVAALGLPTAQGLVLTETFYWDLNDATRAWTKRWHAERNAPGKYPAMNQAGVYAGTLHYLKARAALGGNPDGKSVVAKMKEMPTDDPLFGKGTIRPDGRKVHPAYLLEVKKPSDSKYPGDFYNVRATIPADQAFRPLKEGNCPLVSG